MAHSRTFVSTYRPVFHVIGIISTVGTVLLWNSISRSDERNGSDNTSKPVVVFSIPSIKHSYADLKLAFDLARDEKGFQTFKDTLDEFLVGVDADSPCGLTLFVTADGLATVVSVPVKDDAAFQKLLKNLWDLDIKTAPPPAPPLQKQVPRSVQDKLHSLKPQANERILFGLMDGALRHEKDHVYLGKTLQVVRQGRSETIAAPDKGASVAIQVRGDIDPSRRRVAFEKSKDDLLSRPKRDKFKNDADFELARAIADYQLAKLELLVADSSQVNAAYSVSRETKDSRFTAEVTAARDTPLADDVARIGQHPDLFAHVSSQNAVVSAKMNVPVDAALGKLFKVVAATARTAVIARIDESARLDAGQKQADKDFAEFLSEIAADIAGMDTFNGLLRTWTDTEGKLTSVGAARVSNMEQFRERLQKMPHRERVPKSLTGVEFHKLINTQWQEHAPELFDAEGCVYVATTDHAIWFGAGPQGLERLEQAVEEAAHGAESKATKDSPPTAIDFHAEMQPLAHVWNAIRSRRVPATEKPVADGRAKPVVKAANKSGSDTSAAGEAKVDRKKGASAVSKSTIADLELHKIASESFEDRDGKISLSLARDGDRARLLITCDAGILRFVGKALSTFTQQNLAD